MLPAGGGIASVLHCPSLLLDSFDQISVQTFRLKIEYYFLSLEFTVCLVPRSRGLNIYLTEAYLEKLVKIPGGLENEIFL